MPQQKVSDKVESEWLKVSDKVKSEWLKTRVSGKRSSQFNSLQAL